jgi:hypothetical protein
VGRFFLCAASQLVLLAWLNAFADSSAPGNPGKFVAILFAAGAAYWLLVASFENVPAKWRALIFWTVAIVLRVVVFPMPPGDDVWRYIWEGKIQLHGFNPYLLGPQAPVLESLRDAGWEKINHPEWAAIYPPAAELGFALLSRISATPWFYKAAFAAADLFTLFFLLRLNTGPGRYRHTAWYAWNPALILAFAGMAHFDSLLLLAMTVSIWALHRADPMGEREPSWTWSVISAVFLGLAIALKTIPVFLLPAWLFALKRRSIVLTISIAIPVFLSSMYGGLGVVTKSLREFAYVSRFNDLVWWLVEKSVWANPAQKNARYTIALLVVVCALAVIFRKDWRRSALWALGAALILSPALHPWYVTWILPLACWRKQQAWFALSLSVFASVLLGENGARLPRVIVWMMVVAPPLLVWIYQYKPKLAKHEHSHS